MLWLLSNPEGHFQLNFQRPLKGLPVVPTIHPAIHSNAHSSCMANELHEVAKKKQKKMCKRSAKKERKKKKRNMADGQKSQKRTHTQNHNLQLPCVSGSLCPSSTGSLRFAGLWLHRERAQRESHRHADSSLLLPPLLPSTLSLFFCSCCFPSYAVTQNGKSDWKWPQVKSSFSSQRLYSVLLVSF